MQGSVWFGMKAKQPAVSTVIRQTAQKYGYHVSKHQGRWYIETRDCQPRPTPPDGLTDEQALAWLLIHGTQ